MIWFKLREFEEEKASVLKWELSILSLKQTLYLLSF